MASVHGQTSRCRGSWRSWDFLDEDQALVLDHDSGKTWYRATVLGTFHPARSRFEWATEHSLFAEPVYESPAFSTTMDALMELFVTTARLGAGLAVHGHLHEKGDIVLISLFGIELAGRAKQGAV